MDIIDEILKTLIHRGKALECNTAGFKYGLGHPPSPRRRSSCATGSWAESF